MTSEQIGSVVTGMGVFLERFRRFFKRGKTFSYWKTYIAGLLAELKRKNIEAIALAAGVAVRTFQEFLAFFLWDDREIRSEVQRWVADEHDSDQAIGVLDATGHRKQGDKTPGVQRQYCGELGKHENCVIAQHLLYTDNDPKNPFSCVLATDLYLPKSWAEDRDRCRAAGIPDELGFRTKWQIGLDQVEQAIGNGIRFSYVVVDEDYGRVPKFWFGLDRLGQRGIGEVPVNFPCWATPPSCRSLRKEHAAKEVRHLVQHSPVFRRQSWKTVKVKDTTRGPSIWRYKAARVQLVAVPHDQRRALSEPTERRYWLIVAENVKTRERKYLISNAPANANVKKLLLVGLSRWHVEKWFERAKQEAGLGAFEVRNYRSLMRHWLSSAMAMLFLAGETKRLRGEKSADYTGASRRRGQQHRVEAVGLAGFVARAGEAVQLLPVT